VIVTLTGATGFIGRRLVRRLLAAGHNVRLLVRHARTGFGPDVECFIWNAYTLDPDPAALDGADCLVHLAGEPVSQRWTPRARRRILDSRVEGTRRLIKALGSISRKPRCMVSASAIGYYGDRGDEILLETSTPGNDFLAGVCQAWEKAAQEAEPLGLRVARLRFGMVLGPEGGALAQMLTPFLWGVGGKIGSGSQWTSWIHADDAVSLILFTLEHSNLAGAVNACSPNPVTNAEFTRELARALKRPALLTVPEWLLRLLYGEMAEILLASQRALPGAAIKAGFQFQYPEIGRALRNLLAGRAA